jgi:hypothetical protein
VKLRLETPPLEPHDERDRVAHDRPTLSIVCERDRDATLAAIRAGIGPARLVQLRTSLRSSPGFQIEGDLVATHPSAARSAMAAALAALPPHDVVLAEGPLAIDLLRARVSIAVVTSESPVLHSRDLRAVRHRVDLWLLDARPAVLSALAARVAAGS